jgi:hypothetical protein
VRPQDRLVNRAEGLEWLSENFTIAVKTIRRSGRSSLSTIPARGTALRIRLYENLSIALKPRFRA